MARNDRDDPVLSFSPPARSNKAGGKFLGFVVVLLGVALGVGGFVLESKSEPVREAGVSTVGVLQEFAHVGATSTQPSGYVAEVEFYTEDGHRGVASARVPVAAQNANVIGKTYKVFYLESNPERTFIQGIDATLSPWPFVGVGALIMLLGGVLILKPRGQ